MVKPAVALAKPFRRSSTTSSPGWRELGVLVVGFVLTVACFMGLTLYADTRLGVVAERTHQVSDNAMPSILELGSVRLGLAQIHFDLGEATEGDRERMRVLPSDVCAFEAAWSRYVDLPRFVGELELQVGMRGSGVDAVEARRRSSAGSHRGGGAARSRRVGEEGAGTGGAGGRRRAQCGSSSSIATRASERRSKPTWHWTRMRRLSVVADVICALVTGALVWLGFRSTRRFISMQKVRADELEAFASRVAHDVRGPLTPALFTLQMFERDFAGDEKRRPMIDRGIRSLKRVDQLVGDLLTFARAAAAPDVDVHTALGPVVAGVAQDIERQAAVAGVRVDVADLPECDVACAPGVLASVVMNLMTNAIKYMPPDAPERAVSIKAALDGDSVRVEVADTGAGLPEAMHERIFEPYVRVDRRQPGLGLGLATVRRLVEAHRGRVGVQSREGRGALFWFAMPLCRADSA